MEDVEPGLMPILLFSVCISDTKRGVYYIPQRGLGIEGIRTDGSVCSIARHIVNAKYTSFEVHIVNPGELTESSIIQAISAWMIKGDEDNSLAGLSEADKPLKSRTKLIVDDTCDNDEDEDNEDENGNDFTKSKCG